LKPVLLRRAGLCLTRILTIFGLNESGSSGTDGSIGIAVDNSGTGDDDDGVSNEKLSSFVDAIADLRVMLRTKAVADKDKDLFTLCDDIRDKVLAGLGVRLTDKALTAGAGVGSGTSYTWSLENPDVLLKEIESRKAAAEEAKKAVEARKAAAKAAAAEKAAAAAEKKQKK
jgi:cysteinyl-tRNA synthetase